MFLTEGVNLIILSLTWGAQIFLRSFLVRYYKWIWRGSVAVIFGIASYWAYLQYSIWQGNSFTRLLLIDSVYFFKYVGFHIYGPWILSLLAATLVGWIVLYLNRRFDRRFFEDEEVPLLALGCFLSGYPAFLLYFVLIFLGGLVLTFVYAVFAWGRAPLYYLWLPAAILAILVKSWLIPGDVLDIFSLGRSG